MRYYSDTEKYEAVTAYYIAGTYTGAEKACGIPEETIRGWSTTSWWPVVLDKVIADVSSKLRARGNQIVDLATSAVIDRLQNGDEITDKHGNFVRRKVSLKDALLASLTWFDKTRIINDKSVRFVANKTTSKELMAEMVSIAQRNRQEAVETIPDFEIGVPSVSPQVLQEGLSNDA